MHLGPRSVLQHCHLRVRPDCGQGEAGVGAIAQHVCMSHGPASPAPSRCLPPSSQGPIHIGAGCFVSGLDTVHSEALHGLELRDLILQGHRVRLHGSPSRVFTLVGRLDSWEVGIYLMFLCLHLLTLGSPRGSGSVTGVSEHWPLGWTVGWWWWGGQMSQWTLENFIPLLEAGH